MDSIAFMASAAGFSTRIARGVASAAAALGSTWSRGDAPQPTADRGATSAGLSLNVFTGPLSAGAGFGVAGAGLVVAGAGAGAGKSGDVGRAAAAGAGAVGSGLPQGSSGTLITIVRGLRTV
jgi:hypothetical protein